MILVSREYDESPKKTSEFGGVVKRKREKHSNSYHNLGGIKKKNSEEFHRFYDE